MLIPLLTIFVGLPLLWIVCYSWSAYEECSRRAERDNFLEERRKYYEKYGQRRYTYYDNSYNVKPTNYWDDIQTLFRNNDANQVH